jgi:hypothetical protein
MGPIIAMLHNTDTGRWHPMFFLPAPQPSAGPDDTATRYKSKMHHTAGFPTREEAEANARGKMAEQVGRHFGHFGPTRFCLSKAFPWDGEDIPAMVTFFAETEVEPVPVF